MTSRQQLLRDGYALFRKPAGGEDGEEGAEGAEGGVGGRGDTIEGGRPGSRRKGALFSVVRDGRGRVVEVEGLHVAMLEASSCRPVRATTHSPRPAGSAHSPMPACDVLFTRAGPNTGGLAAQGPTQGGCAAAVRPDRSRRFCRFRHAGGSISLRARAPDTRLGLGEP